MARIIAIVNQKGGVAKTTLSVNLASALALGGNRTLLIDLDPQGASSDACGFDEHSKDSSLTVKDWYENPEPALALKHLYETTTNNLWLFPNVLGTTEIALVIQSKTSPSAFIDDFLKVPSIKAMFDYVIIDTPPNLDVHFRNAVYASDYLVVPANPEIKTVKGMANLHKALGEVNRSSSARLLGIVLTRVETTNTHKRIVEFFKQSYKDLIFKTEINKAKDFPEADQYGKMSVLEHAPSSKAADSIMDLIDEITERIDAIRAGRRQKPKLWDKSIEVHSNELAQALKA